MAEQAVEVVRRVYDAFGRGDMQAVGEMFAETEWHEAEGMPYGGVYRGSDEIFENVFGPITQDVDGFTVHPEEFLDAGDRVVSLGRYAGTGANGPVDVAFAHVWTVTGERITKFVQYADTRKFAEAVEKT